MINLITRKTLPAYKITHPDNITTSEIDKLICICCSKNLFDSEKQSYLLYLEDKIDVDFFFNCYDDSLLKSISNQNNLSLCVNKSQIQKFSKHKSGFFLEEKNLEPNLLLKNYFNQHSITISSYTIDNLLDFYNSEIQQIINEVTLIYLQIPDKEVVFYEKNSNNPIFNYIDDYIISNSQKSKEFFFSFCNNSQAFLTFLSLLFKKVELIINLKLLSEKYNLKDISYLLNKNSYYIKNTLLISNKITYIKLENLIILLADIDFLYKHGKIKIEYALDRLFI